VVKTENAHIFQQRFHLAVRRPGIVRQTVISGGIPASKKGIDHYTSAENDQNNG